MTQKKSKKRKVKEKDRCGHTEAGGIALPAGKELPQQAARRPRPQAWWPGEGRTGASSAGLPGAAAPTRGSRLIQPEVLPMTSRPELLIWEFYIPEYHAEFHRGYLPSCHRAGSRTAREGRRQRLVTFSGGGGMLLLRPISGNNRLHEASSCTKLEGVGHPDRPFLEVEA